MSPGPLEMAGTIQILGFRLPTSVRRLDIDAPSAPLMVSRVRLLRHHVFPSALPTLSVEVHPVIRRPRASSGFDLVDDSRHCNANNFGPPELFIWGKLLLNFARNNFLPLALVSGITLGLASPQLGRFADKYPISKFSTVGIFFISGLMLRSEEIGAAIKAWPVGILGLISILFLTPLFTRMILQVHLNPQEFITGLAIFCCMPTTLSSGVALTQLVGGNSALALAMTVISNLFGIVTVPLSLANLIGGAGVSIPTMRLLKSLITTLLIPLTLGKVPGMQVSRSKPLLLAVKPEIFATAVAMGVLLHLILLAFNASTLQILSVISGGKASVLLKSENAQAFIIVASQKTLPVMVAVVEQLKGALGEPGLLVLPCVAAHINQELVCHPFYPDTDISDGRSWSSSSPVIGLRLVTCGGRQSGNLYSNLFELTPNETGIGILLCGFGLSSVGWDSWMCMDFIAKSAF